MKKYLVLPILIFVLNTAVGAQPTDQLKRASQLFDQGLDHYRNNRYDAAIASYTEYLKIRPTVAVAWYNRGLAYKQKADAAMSRPDYERALADLSRAVELEPKDADAWLNRGFVRLKLVPVDFNKQVRLALVDFSGAIKLKPNLSDAYTGRAQVYEESNRQAEAMADANKALRLNPHDYVALYIRGKLHTNAKNYAAARNDLEKAIKLYPDYFAAKSQLSYVNSEVAKPTVTATVKPPITTKTPAVISPPSTAITDASVGFKLADDAEKAGDYRKVIDAVTKTLPLIAMESEGLPSKDLEEFVYLDLLRKRAKAYLVLKQYKEAEDEYALAVLHAIKNMNRHNARANNELRKDMGSGGGAIMATVQTASSKIICNSTFTAVSEWSDTLERQQSNDMTLRFAAGIYMATIRESCATTFVLDGGFEEVKAYGYFGSPIKTKQFNTAIERYTTAIQYLKVYRPAYVARAKAYRELGRNDLALADEQKAAQLPVK